MITRTVFAIVVGASFLAMVLASPLSRLTDDSAELTAANKAIGIVNSHLKDAANAEKALTGLDKAAAKCVDLEDDLADSRKNLEAWNTLLASAAASGADNVYTNSNACIDQLTQDASDLAGKSDALDQLEKTREGTTPKQELTKDEKVARTHVQDKKDEVNKEIDKLKDAQQKLRSDTTSAVASIGRYADTLTSSYKELARLDPAAVTGDNQAQRVRSLCKVLIADLPAADLALRLTTSAGKSKPVAATVTNVSGRLAILRASYLYADDWATPFVGLDSKFAGVSTDVNLIVPHIAGFFKEISDYNDSLNDNDQLRKDFKSDPFGTGSKVEARINDLRENATAVKNITDGWISFHGVLDELNVLPTDVNSASDGFVTMMGGLGRMTSNRIDLQDALAGDMDVWVTDQVTLYYFTNVREVIAALNENYANVDAASDAQKDYVKARKEARDRQTDYENAYDALTNKTNRYTTLVVQLDAAKHDLDIKQADLDRAISSVKAKQKAADNATAANDKAQTALQASPDDPALKEAAAAALQEKTDADNALADANQKEADAQSDRDAARTLAQGTREEEKGLPFQIATAEKTLEDASQAMKAARNAVNNAAQDQVDTFARARDNAPFIVARANATSPDPMKRVTLFAYDDSKTILIRGKKSDVDNVKEVIAEFDRPSPQARITLWTMQVNTTGSRSGRSNLGTALEEIDRELSETRGYIADSTSLLRDCLNRRVQNVQDKWLPYVRTPTALQPELTARNYFYEPEVARRLGFDEAEAIFHPNVYYFTQWTLPDPAASTTLGETLMILSLGTEPNRRAVMLDFVCRLHAYLKDHYKAHDIKDKLANEDIIFEHLRRELDLDDPAYDGALAKCDYDVPVDCGHVHAGNVTAAQLEILSALKRAALEKFIDNAPALVDLIGSQSAEFGKYRSPSQWDEEMHTESRQGKEKLFSASERYDLGDFDKEDLARFLVPALVWLKAEFGVLPGWLEHLSEDPFGGMDVSAADKNAPAMKDFAINLQVRRKYPAAQANARIAAADDMLKRINISFEDDLDECFMQPLLHNLRIRIRAKDLDLGVVERTSLLTTNRQIARVDPSASAQLDLAGKTDLVQAAQQFQVLNDAVRTGSFQKTASALTGLNKEPASELYALTSGSEFKVTPVFDPSGQALRFQFDYLYSTKIRAPDGTVNPQIPQIDRHAVNTTVQLSNMELREISRFENNTGVGVPPKYWGGIPLLNQIPVLDRVPIIGWFSRRDGRAASSQASLIFAQTAMYPTIGDLSNLLTGPIAIPSFGPGGEKAKR